MIQFSPYTFITGMAVGDIYKQGSATSMVVGGAFASVLLPMISPGTAQLLLTHVSFAFAYGVLRIMDYDIQTALLGGLVLGFLGFSIDVGLKTQKWYRDGSGVGGQMPYRGQRGHWMRMSRAGDLDQNP